MKFFRWLRPRATVVEEQPSPERIAFTLSPSVRERVERMGAATGVDSVLQVISNSLQLYEAIIDLRQRGGIPLVRYHDGAETMLFAQDEERQPERVH
jgi:hypothetical protein